MDKYEFTIKVEQIRKLMSKADYVTAMKIADTIDWRKVHSANTLSMVSQVYEKNKEYREAKEILLLAFERAPIGKRLLYKLTDLALKDGAIDEAEAYYREFCDMANDDPRQYLLRYMILKQKGAPIEQLIHSLESYTAEELDEKWLYELAELYHQAGDSARCVTTCDKIMLMFGLGKYVDKAMELKLQYAPLTSYQMDLVENREKYEEKLRAVELSFSEESDAYEKEKLEVEVKQAEVEADLAKEMTRLQDGVIEEPVEDVEKTRVIETVEPIAVIEEEEEFLVEDEPEETEEVELPTMGNHLLIEARTPEKGLEMAIATLKQIQEETGIKNPVAKISGSKLNKLGVMASAEKLVGKDLMVEEAGDLSADMLRELEQLMTHDQSGMRIILIDNPKQVEMLHAQNPELASKFECIGCGENRKETLESRTAVETAEELAEKTEMTADENAKKQNKKQAKKQEKKHNKEQNKEQGKELNKEPDQKQEELHPKEKNADVEKPVDDRPVRHIVPKRENEIPVQKATEPEEELDIDEFAQYACQYASEIDCSITGKSMLALYERIEIMEEEGIKLTRTSAEDLIEEAADKAENPSFAKKIAGLFSSKYNKDGLLILKEEHFIS